MLLSLHANQLAPSEATLYPRRQQLDSLCSFSWQMFSVVSFINEQNKLPNVKKLNNLTYFLTYKPDKYKHTPSEFKFPKL